MEKQLVGYLLSHLIRQDFTFKNLLTRSQDLRVGVKYRLERRIGGGGFGHVYLGWNHVQLCEGYADTA